MNGILIFVLSIAAVGAALGVVAAGVGNKRVNIFKTQAGAWLVTIIMVVAAIGIGYAKAPIHAPAPEPGLQQGPGAMPSYVWDNAKVLSGETVRLLDERNLRLYDRYRASIGVVTCNYSGDDLGGYAMQCAEDMGLGGYDFTVILDIKGDNYWLVQGDDIRRDFTDKDCTDYAYNYMETWFAAGDYDFAVEQLTEMLELWYGTYYG